MTRISRLARPSLSEKRRSAPYPSACVRILKGSWAPILTSLLRSHPASAAGEKCQRIEHLVSLGRSRGVLSKQEPKPLDKNSLPRIGVLAIQGDYASHAQAIAEAGGEPIEVRKPEELADVDALVLPGGESTTILRFLDKRHFFDSLRAFCSTKPVMATCAGAILLAREVLNPPQRSLALLDAVLERNAYGRQIDSAILIEPTELPGGPLEMVYIRAPRIAEVGPNVEVLARRDGFPTLVRQGKILAATFHPELSADRRVHRLFLQMVSAQK